MRAIPPHIRGSEIERARRKQRRNAPLLSERARWREKRDRKIACASLSQLCATNSGCQMVYHWLCSKNDVTLLVCGRQRRRTK